MVEQLDPSKPPPPLENRSLISKQGNASVPREQTRPSTSSPSGSLMRSTKSWITLIEAPRSPMPIDFPRTLGLLPSPSATKLDSCLRPVGVTVRNSADVRIEIIVGCFLAWLAASSKSSSSCCLEFLENSVYSIRNVSSTRLIFLSNFLKFLRSHFYL